MEQWARRRTTAQGLAQQARIVLMGATSASDTQLAAELGITRQTVGRWRRRFLARRLDGLLDEPRPGAPRRLSDAVVERVLTRTLETTLRDATHWSTRSFTLTGNPVRIAERLRRTPGGQTPGFFTASDSGTLVYASGSSNAGNKFEWVDRGGRAGRQIGEFHWVHVVSADSEGNLYTGEVDNANRVQKFLRYGPAGCSGTGVKEVGKYR